MAIIVNLDVMMAKERSLWVIWPIVSVLPRQIFFDLKTGKAKNYTLFYS